MGVLRQARLTFPATINGVDTEGVFELKSGLSLSPRVKSGELIGPQGQIVRGTLQLINATEGRGDVRFRLGGIPVADVDFDSFEGSDGQFGDGSSDPARDASGEETWRQISVLYKYLVEGGYDSLGAGKLEWGEFNDVNNGEFEPFSVSPQEPTQTFDVTEELSSFSGSITLVSTAQIENAYISQQQDGGR
jgi:hypothetical protein